jgi:hypothetical protein
MDKASIHVEVRAEFGFRNVAKHLLVDGTAGSPVEFFVVGNSQSLFSAAWLKPSQLYVTAALRFCREPEERQNS